MAKILYNGTVIEGKDLVEADYSIKVFNLTTLRKKGFSFTPDGVLSGNGMSLRGRWLNIIDDVIRVEFETEDEIIVNVFGKLDVIPKNVKGLFYKIVK